MKPPRSRSYLAIAAVLTRGQLSDEDTQVDSIAVVMNNVAEVSQNASLVPVSSYCLCLKRSDQSYSSNNGSLLGF